jgi:glycosyltransferase involved in cell wall biosynthesis
MHKVLIISATPIISGAEYVLGDFLQNTKYKKQIQILHSDIKEVNDFYSKFEVNKIYKSKYLKPVGVVNNNFNIIKKIYNLIASFFIFRKIFKYEDIGIVLGNNTGDTIYSIYSYLFGKKHINYIHDMIEKDSFIAKSIIFFDKFIFKYIAVSNAVKNALIDIGIKENKIKVIYNGVDYNSDFNFKELDREIVFGFIGNIDDRKNPLEFLRFIEIFKNSYKEKKVKGKMVFSNVLDEKLFYKIKQIIKEKNLPIELIGKLNRENMKGFYNSIHFLVLTSKKDPLPTVILEAFDNGIPVIAHNIDGVPEMIEDNKNGFLYNNENDFEKIVNKIKVIDYNQLQKNANLTIKNKFNNLKKIEELNNVLFLKYKDWLKC